MPRITVSAVRIRSLLKNRHLRVEEVAQSVALSADLRALVERDVEVDFGDLLILAKYFKRPWSYLLSDEEEHFPNLGQDNRTFANRQAPVSPELIVEYEAASLMIDTAVELFPESAYEIPSVRLAPDVMVSRVAPEIRAFLAVSYSQQTKASDAYAALRIWVEALQRRGVYVSQRSLRDKTVRAFSKVRDGQALIVVDTTDTPYARIFSILHEYCHVLLRSTGICDLDEHSAIEHYCNEIAASVLLPDDLLSAQMSSVTFGNSAEEDDEQLIRLSHFLHVSQAALLIRLQGNGAISETLFNSMETRRQRRRAGDAGKKGGDYYPAAINRVGRLFALNVFGAVSEGTLDRQDAGMLLGIGEHIVDRFRSELFEGGAAK